MWQGVSKSIWVVHAFLSVQVEIGCRASWAGHSCHSQSVTRLRCAVCLGQWGAELRIKLLQVVCADIAMADPPWYSQRQACEDRVRRLEYAVQNLEQRLVKLEILVLRTTEQVTTIMQAFSMMLQEVCPSDSVHNSIQEKTEASHLTNIPVAVPSNNQENVAGPATAPDSQEQELWQAMDFPSFAAYLRHCHLEELRRRLRNGPWDDDDWEAWKKVKKADGDDTESIRQEWFAETVWLRLKKLLELRWPNVLWAFFLHPRKV